LPSPWFENKFLSKAGLETSFQIRQEAFVRQIASEDTDFTRITRHMTRSANVPLTGIKPRSVRMPNSNGKKNEKKLF